MPVLNGVSYAIAQPCLDLAAQMKALGIQNLGIVGDLSHQAGCGDHVPWQCTGHYGKITAIDIGWGGTVNGVRLTPALLRRYLLPRLRAHTWEFYQIKYIITNYLLNDTRAPYNLKDQTGGDGPDHMHISFLNSAFSARCALLTDFVAWVRAGQPNPVTFKAGSAPASSEDSTVSATTLSDGRTLFAIVGTDGKIYRSTDPTVKYSLVGNSTWLAGVGVAAVGKTAYFAVRDEDKSIHLVTISDLDSGAGYVDEKIGGTGSGAPAIAVTLTGLRLLVKGTDPKGTLYVNTFDRTKPAGQQWTGWKPTPGQAK